ncbi:MAG TPA: c-type cytochrome, partial [Planctomycetota bacterium]|nr:c-type cytochrome [Planctomycetota bacterium]
GRVSEVLLTPSKEGVFRYYCTTICGEPHFGMQGEAVVVGQGGSVPPQATPSPGKYWLEPAPPPGPLRSLRGRWLFRRHGCFTCHGEEGKGGVPNWNYVKDTVPALNTLAERMFVPDREGAEAVLAVLERREGVDRLSADPPFARFKAFLAQYQSVKDLIRKGNPPGKKDPSGLQPPLEMPSFGARLSDGDIEDLMTYLLKLQHWEGDDK